MRRYEIVEYTHEDIDDLERNLTVSDIINVLGDLEGGWMPHMPSFYH